MIQQSIQFFPLSLSDHLKPGDEILEFLEILKSEIYFEVRTLEKRGWCKVDLWGERKGSPVIGKFIFDLDEVGKP